MIVFLLSYARPKVVVQISEENWTKFYSIKNIFKIAKMNTRRNGRNDASENSANTNINRVINAEPGQVLPTSPARQARDLAAPQVLANEYSHSGMEEASPTPPTPPDPPVRAKTTKKTPDVKWSQIMKDKLVQQVYLEKLTSARPKLWSKSTLPSKPHWKATEISLSLLELGNVGRHSSPSG